MAENLEFWKLLAGLGLFLFAMNILETSLKKLAGKGFRRFLRNSTDKPISSVFGGIFATAIVQSSSLVGLIVLAFVGAGIIPLVNAIGIVIGSNLGTTFTGWIVTTLGFNLDFATFIFPLLALGGISYGLLKGRWQIFSQFVVGFSLLLLGLEFMKDSVSSLSQSADITILKDYPLIMYLIAGVIFTAIIQSSSATMMLTLSALYAGVIPLQAAAALVIGADLGTTSTVLIGSLQGAVAKRRLAMAHVIFNFSVDAATFIFIGPLLALVLWLGIVDPLYSLVAFHSLFNLIGLIFFLPILSPFSKFLENKIPEKEHRLKQFIHKVPADISDAAIEAMAKESRQLLFLVIYHNYQYLKISKQPQTIQSIENNLPRAIKNTSKINIYISIKNLEGEIINYAHQVQSSQEAISKTEEIRSDLKIDRIISAVRAGIYSAKSVKDISQDLESFDLLDNQKFEVFYSTLLVTESEMLTQIYVLLSAINDQQTLDEELGSLSLKLEQFHAKFNQDIYKQISSLNLTSLEVSTLFNVSKELNTSITALIKALHLINLH
jgi:phosphate:Na+ symporter